MRTCEAMRDYHTPIEMMMMPPRLFHLSFTTSLHRHHHHHHCHCHWTTELWAIIIAAAELIMLRAAMLEGYWCHDAAAPFSFYFHPPRWDYDYHLFILSFIIFTLFITIYWWFSLFSRDDYYYYYYRHLPLRDSYAATLLLLMLLLLLLLLMMMSCWAAELPADGELMIINYYCALSVHYHFHDDYIYPESGFGWRFIYFRFHHHFHHHLPFSISRFSFNYWLLRFTLYAIIDTIIGLLLPPDGHYHIYLSWWFSSSPSSAIITSATPELITPRGETIFHDAFWVDDFHWLTLPRRRIDDDADAELIDWWIRTATRLHATSRDDCRRIIWYDYHYHDRDDIAPPLPPLHIALICFYAATPMMPPPPPLRRYDADDFSRTITYEIDRDAQRCRAPLIDMIRHAIIYTRGDWYAAASCRHYHAIIAISVRRRYGWRYGAQETIILMMMMMSWWWWWWQWLMMMMPLMMPKRRCCHYYADDFHLLSIFSFSLFHWLFTLWRWFFIFDWRHYRCRLFMPLFIEII